MAQDPKQGNVDWASMAHEQHVKAMAIPYALKDTYLFVRYLQYAAGAECALGDPVRGLAYLKVAHASAVSITDECLRNKVLAHVQHRLAQALFHLGCLPQASVMIERAVTAFLDKMQLCAADARVKRSQQLRAEIHRAQAGSGGQLGSCVHTDSPASAAVTPAETMQCADSTASDATNVCAQQTVQHAAQLHHLAAPDADAAATEHETCTLVLWHTSQAPDAESSNVAMVEEV